MFFRRCLTEKPKSAVASPAEDVLGSVHTQDGKQNAESIKGATSRVRTRRRGSVSAEVSSLSIASFRQPTVVEKSDEAKARIRAAIKHSFLLKGLEDEQKDGIVDAMFERTAAPGDVIIREGEEGDNFYVIESGDFVAVRGGKQVFKYEGHGAFGELALMYNCLRAATVQAVTAGVLWGVDRVTFRDIVVAAAAQRRARFETALAAMPIFSGLTPEQRAAVADCLEPETAAQGDYILHEGAPLSADARFYLVESGTIHCCKTVQGGRRRVATISDGGFFGEVALLTHAPRAADCIAASPKVKLLSMGRDAFERLMGPVEEILAGKIREYAEVDERLRTNSIPPEEDLTAVLGAEGAHAAQTADVDGDRSGAAAGSIASAGGDGTAKD